MRGSARSAPFPDVAPNWRLAIWLKQRPLDEISYLRDWFARTKLICRFQLASLSSTLVSWRFQVLTLARSLLTRSLPLDNLPALNGTCPTLSRPQLAMVAERSTIHRPLPPCPLSRELGNAVLPEDVHREIEPVINLQVGGLSFRTTRGQ